MEVPAVADAVGRDERRERRAQAVGARGGADRLAREQLIVRRRERILRVERELELRPAVLGVDLADAEPVAVEVAQQLRDELAHVEHRVRAVDRAAVRRDRLVGVLADEPLELAAGLELVAQSRRALDDALERRPVAVLPARAFLQPELAGGPREGGLAGQLHDPLGHGLDAEVAGRRVDALDAPGDVIVGVEHGKQEGAAHAAFNGGGELVDGRGARALDAVRIAPGDGEGAYALGLELGSESREIRVAHGCSFGRVLDIRSREGIHAGRRAGQRPRAGRYDRRVPGAVTLRDLVADLVAIDSVNPDLVPGGAGEMEIARFIAGWLERAGVEARIDEVAPGRANVIGVARGRGGGRTLLLNGHTDTVGHDGYERPLEPRIEGDRLYGRGGFDMKGGTAAALWACAEAAKLGLAGDVVVTAVCDEEFASIGTQAVAAQVRAGCRDRHRADRARGLRRAQGLRVARGRDHRPRRARLAAAARHRRDRQGRPRADRHRGARPAARGGRRSIRFSALAPCTPR